MTLQDKSQSAASWTDTPFELEVKSLPNATLVCVRGSCTMSVADRLTQKLVDLASEQTPLIIIDMAGLDFIESTGLGGIVAGYLRARKNGGEIRLLSPPPFIRQLLQLTRLTQLFQICTTLDDAQRTG